MTAWRAFTTLRSKFEVHGIHPCTVWDKILHSLGLCPGMNFMARPARPASFFVNVDVVQVFVAVTKVGQGRRAFIQNERIFMTLEAQIVHFD